MGYDPCVNCIGDINIISDINIFLFANKLLKIERDDLGYDQDWLVADAHLTQTTDIPRHHAKQICNPKRPATYVPGRRGHRRFEFKLMPGETKEEIEKEEKVWELLSPWINPSNASLERADAVSYTHLTLPTNREV